MTHEMSEKKLHRLPCLTPILADSDKSRDPLAWMSAGTIRGKIIPFNIRRKRVPGNLTYMI